MRIIHEKIQPKIVFNNNTIKIKTYKDFLVDICLKCNNENIYEFKGAKEYICNKCGSMINVVVLKKFFGDKQIYD